jgi:hypothetical protein
VRDCLLCFIFWVSLSKPVVLLNSDPWNDKMCHQKYNKSIFCSRVQTVTLWNWKMSRLSSRKPGSSLKGNLYARTELEMKIMKMGIRLIKIIACFKNKCFFCQKFREPSLSLTLAQTLRQISPSSWTRFLENFSRAKNSEKLIRSAHTIWLL